MDVSTTDGIMHIHAQMDLYVLNTVFTNPDELIRYKKLFMSKKEQWEYLLTIVNGKITWYAADNFKDALNDAPPPKGIMCIQDNYIEYLDCYDECDEPFESTRDNMDFVNQFNIELTEPKKKEKKEDEKEELSVEKVKVNELINFNYESRCKGMGVYKQYKGVIEKITKKTMIIGGYTYKKEKMVIVAE